MKTNLGDRHILISPSRTYVLFVADQLNLNESSKDHIYKITVPESYQNTEIGAGEYFFTKIDPDAAIINCLTYEMYAEQELAKRFEDPFKNRRDLHQSKRVTYNLYYENDKIINELKEILADFYGEQEDDIDTSEIPSRVKTLQKDNLRYIDTISKIKGTLKNSVP